jgi:ABC-type dipeptide/oligopeptide/nickel transport system permease subunit
VGAAAPEEFYDAYTFDVESRSLWARALHRFLGHRLAVASVVLLTLVFAAGLLASHLAPYTYQQLNINALSAAPSWAHPFGTDQFGRDYFSRVLYGIGTEAEIALVVAFFGTLIGTLVGAFCGYYGGVVDNVLMRGTDLFLTLPPLITLLVAVSYLQATGVFKVSLLIAALLWMPIARIVRGSALSLREREYVEAARAMGASDLRIIARHILPNAMSAVAVAASVMVAAAIVLETTLSYLGFGVIAVEGVLAQPHTQNTIGSLGDVMFVAGQEGLFHWWGIVFPGLAVIAIVMPIYFIGDGIRDALDPTERRYAGAKRQRKKRAPSRAVSRLVAAVPWPQRAISSARKTLSGVPVRRWLVTLLRPIRPALAVATSMRIATGDMIARRSRRRASRRGGVFRLLLEALVVICVTAGAAVAIYVWKVNPVSSSWPAAGTHVQNLSHAAGAQTEVSVAVAPSTPQVLFAASNDTGERTIRVYSSTDGGRTWSSKVGPSLGLDACARGEPAVTTTQDGREYVAFVVSALCTDQDPAPYLAVASRPSPQSPWEVKRVAARPGSELFDAKPSLAAGPDGRVYVAWSRRLTQTYATTVVSSSRNQGRTWSRPMIVSRKLVQPHLVNATVDPQGRLYVTGVDVRFGLWVARSDDQSRGFSIRRAAPLRFEVWNDPSSCAIAQKFPTAFEAARCLGPNPTITATGRRVYITYSGLERNGTHGVSIVVLDPTLRHLWSGRVGLADSDESDQFWPASAVDSSAGMLWSCYYDTSGDPSREVAWFTCSVSRDGRHWATPVRVARERAKADVLWEDARIYEFGDVIGYGGYTGLAVADGLAHPMWIDTVGEGARAQEIFTAGLSAQAFVP